MICLDFVLRTSIDKIRENGFELTKKRSRRWASTQFLSLPIVLARCDFYLFPKLRGGCYETIEEMSEAVTMVIDTLTQEDFH